MIRPRPALLLFALAGLLAPSAALAADARSDFGLGNNGEGQACRAVARFDAPKGARSADIYCGAWERPSGRVTVYAAGAPPAVAPCEGEAAALQSTDFTELKQVACARKGDDGPRRYALSARRGDRAIVGEVYPSDWAPLLNAARVLSGAAAPQQAAVSGGDTPGLREIQSVFPAGPPGQSAAVNYELLRRRAYEYNVIWSFGTAQRDFEELLRLHNQVAPDDLAGEAEVLAEIGLNMSSIRQFAEAGDVLAQAESRARAAGEDLMVTKIANYRAIDQLNQRRYAAALRIALQANQARAALRGEGRQGSGVAITSGDVGRSERLSARTTRRSLLVSLGDAPEQDKAEILTAQGYYIAGVAARGLQRPDAATFLASAANQLNQVTTPPAWLVGDIVNERADQRLAAGDFAGAVEAAQAGLAIVKTVAPGTRSEAHLWLTLEGAQAGLGRMDDALASGRAALALSARQSEAPGMPTDVAAVHLGVLDREWRRTGDAKLADEYFETLALVWDGAAARTTAQLAARLAVRQAGDEARGYQDADRGYRAALARRQSLSGDPEARPEDIARADTAIRNAATRLAAAEGALRERAPAYLELLNPRASAADLRGVLHDHEGYLRIVMGAREGYGALVDRQGVHPFRIAMGAAEVEALADRLRRSTHLKGRRLPDFDIEAAQKLYAALLGPVRDLTEGVTDLDVDVSGALASIPFAALIETPPTQAQLAKIGLQQDYSGVAWVARRMSVANTLGPAAFMRLRSSAPATGGPLSATVYGDFRPNPAEVAARLAKARNLSDACRKQIERALQALGALPETADEARGVAAKFSDARLVLGDDFTDSDFLTNPKVASADVIMLATHGVLAVSSCFAEPALLASVGTDGDGLIEASQLFDRQLKARIVVLSACDTAAGGKLDEARTGLSDGGDALSGLARGFIYAGARDVLATQWKVDAASSSAEMSAFFEAANRGGVTFGQALAEAQKSLYDEAETAHPFYWAAFVLVGDGAGALGGARVASAAAPAVHAGN